MADERFLVLVVRHYDGDLNDAETAELNALLRADPECRRLFAEHGTQGCLLREAAAPERHEPLFPPPRPPRTRRRVLLLVSAACLIVAATAVLLSWPPARPRVVGLIEAASGDVRVITPEGEVRVVAAPSEIRSGDTVRTEVLRGSAAVVYPDATRLTLVADTAVTFSGEGRKRVLVHEGTVAASVTPQPEESPMVLATAAARIEVRGTEFYCQALRDRTDVSVIKGHVRVVRTSDGRAVEVTAGKRVLAEAGAAFEVEDIAGPPDAFDLDFEQGLPANLHRGRFVGDGLPRGSKGAVGSVRAVLGKDSVLYEIATPDRWYRGLFAVHDDTHVHCTYKMDRPGWINLFILARGPGPKSPHSGNYLFTGVRQPRRGQWLTMSVPLAEFRRAGAGKGPPLARDEVPYMILFSSPEDRGLVIDRLWVTRGGPGVVRFENGE